MVVNEGARGVAQCNKVGAEAANSAVGARQTVKTSRADANYMSRIFRRLRDSGVRWPLLPHRKSRSACGTSVSLAVREGIESTTEGL